MHIIGKKFLVDFNFAKSILQLQSETSLTFTTIELQGKKTDDTETVAIQLTELRPQLYLLTWKEKNGNAITQIQDHEKSIVYMNWAHPDGQFINTTATITPLN